MGDLRPLRGQVLGTRIRFSFVVLVAAWAGAQSWGCNQTHTASQPEYHYQIPAARSDGWTVASLADVGMREEPIVSLMEQLLGRDHLYHAVLVARDGRLVLEEYFSGSDLDIRHSTLNRQPVRQFDADTLHFQASVTKSVTSALVGLAVDAGLIESEDTAVFDYYPEHADLRSAEKTGITLAQMLTMSSGLAWDESTYAYDDPRSDTHQLLFSPDPVRFVLGQSLETPPGAVFLYNSGTTNVLGDVVRQTSHQVLTEFARQHLFEPLGIDSFEWKMCDGAPEVAFASGGLYLKPRAMAKIGQLFLGRGVWDGERVLSADWVARSTRVGIVQPESVTTQLHTTGYGYQWWLETYNAGAWPAYSARGWGDQYIVVVPDARLVVVFTGGAYDGSSPIAYYDLIERFIIPAVR